MKHKHLVYISLHSYITVRKWGYIIDHFCFRMCKWSNYYQKNTKLLFRYDNIWVIYFHYCTVLKKDGEPKLFEISIDAIFSQLFFETKTFIIFQTHIHKFEKNPYSYYFN